VKLRRVGRAIVVDEGLIVLRDGVHD